jgi:ATP-dependent Clp protease ATP-binding subunit ClpA
MKQAVMNELRAGFRPEFLNRIDEIIVFHGLKAEHLKQIVTIQMEDVRKSLADRHIRLTLTDEASAHLVETGYDPVYGARPLKRAIQKQVVTKLGRLIIEGKVHDGDEVEVDYDPGTKELRFVSMAVAA